MAERTIRIEVVCALPDAQPVRVLIVPFGTTAGTAARLSGFVEASAGEDAPCLGIFARRVAFDHPLQDGDRVEIYRPLACDPKEARRRRASR
jgi:putative ubiquitin-RnfH superfamily antitoxin RatB of RatAB toxin-antitoxin module